MIAAKPAEYDALWSYISWLNGGNVILNRNGEALLRNYASVNDVVMYCRGGGVYVDYCGWPMYYDSAGGSPSKQRFKDFLAAAGADPNYCLGFWSQAPALFPSPGYPYRRSWVSPEPLPQSGGIINASYEAPSNKYTGWMSAVVPGQRQSVTFWTYTAVAVNVGSGWYFYGTGDVGGTADSRASVNPQVYARFIKGLVPVGQTPGSTGTDNPVSTGGLQCVPDNCAGEPVLRYGDRGPCVGWVQRRLKQLGYAPGPTDCDFGPRTQAAISKFQKDKGLVTGGVVDAATWAALKGATGDGGADQERCRKAGGTWDASRNMCITPMQATWRADECRMLGRTWDPVTDECVGPKLWEEIKEYLPYAGIAALAGVGIYLLVRANRRQVSLTSPSTGLVPVGQVYSRKVGEMATYRVEIECLLPKSGIPYYHDWIEIQAASEKDAIQQASHIWKIPKRAGCSVRATRTE
jgi:peptidoglycan hydrolase-like protein with peptidoglycan-binding domain